MTICTQNRINYFCDVETDRWLGPGLNEIGKLVNYWWKEIPKQFNNVLLDEFVVMPNYLHGILAIDENNKIEEVIQWYKNMTTDNYLAEMKINDWPQFNQQLWQKEYYEQPIQNKKEYLMAKKYIKNNPNLFLELFNRPEKSKKT